MKKNIILVILASIFFTLTVHKSIAAEPPIQITLKIENHLFFPETLRLPKHKAVKLLVINLDETAEEFESNVLNKEKIIPGGGRTIIYFEPLQPGEYPFYGEFNPTTAKGMIVVE